MFWIIFKGRLLVILLKTNSQWTVITQNSSATHHLLLIKVCQGGLCHPSHRRKTVKHKMLSSKIYHYFSKRHQQESALKISTLLIVAHKYVICEVWLQSASVAEHIPSYGSKLFTRFLSIETFAFKAALGCCYCSKWTWVSKYI